MTKTLDDYMNNLEIAHEPMPWREIHAIRLQIYDETKGTDVRPSSGGDSLIGQWNRSSLHLKEPSLPCDLCWRWESSLKRRALPSH
jgi:hypothetical protein